MTAEPYTPNEDELAHCYAGVMEESGENFEIAQADAERGIAKIKADALREAADRAEEPLGSEEQDGDTDPYFHGARYGVRRVADWMRVRADRIEEEA